MHRTPPAFDRPLLRRTAGLLVCVALALQVASAHAAGPAGAWNRYGTSPKARAQFNEHHRATRTRTRRRGKGYSRAPLKAATAAPLCVAPMSRMLRTTLYFGLSKPGGAVVSEAEWKSFVSEEVTPRFPDGLTAWEADGQWRREDGTIIRERTRVLLLVHEDGAEARSKIDALIARYKKLFEQKSVMWEAAPVCVAF
jgi:hypothetical protein